MITYIKNKLAKLKPKMPCDDQLSIIHSIYNHLESKGVHRIQAKAMIDKVIAENVTNLKQELENILKEDEEK